MYSCWKVMSNFFLCLFLLSIFFFDISQVSIVSLFILIPEKFENTFSRSRSSSTSSIKDINTEVKDTDSEYVVYLRFCESYGGKTGKKSVL